MSVGAVDPTQPPPFDPEAARLAAMQPPPAMPAPEPTPAMPITPITPATAPAPTGIAAIDPSAVANSIAAIGAQPASAPTPAGPPGTLPATPAGAPPETLKQTDDIKAANDLAAKAREDSDKAQVDLQKAGQPAADEQLKIREQQVHDQQESMRQEQQLQQRYQAAEDAATKQIDASQQAIKGFKFRDYFDDGKGGTNWALKIGTALSAAIGAFGAGLTHGPNYALQVLNKNMDDAHQHQLDELGKMKDEEVMQRTGLQDIRAARSKAMADLTVNDAARDKLVAAQLDQAAARKESAQFAPSLTAAAAKLKQEAAEKDAAAKAALVQLNLKLADEGRKKAVDESTIAKNNAEAGLANKKTDVGGFAPRHGAAGAGGGSGGHSEALADLQAGIPAPQVQAKYKLSDKGLAALVTTAGKIGTGARADTRAGQQGEKLDETRFKDFEKEHGLPKLEFTQHKLSEVLNKLDTGNPVGAMSSLMEFDAAAKGGNATESSMHAIQGRLGGLWTQIKGAVEKGESGNFGADQIATLRGAVKDALAGNKESVDKVHDAFGRQFDYSKPGVKQRAAGMFGALGYRGAGEGGGAPVDEAKVARAQAAKNSPSATAAQKANAAAYLQSVGR